MLMMVLLDAIIVVAITFTVMHKLPIHFKVVIYKIPIWLLSMILDALLLLPAGGFAFGALAALVAEPIIYPMLIWDKRRTMKYVEKSINIFGKIVEPDKMRAMKKVSKSKDKQPKKKKWYEYFLND